MRKIITDIKHGDYDILFYKAHRWFRISCEYNMVLYGVF